MADQLYLKQVLTSGQPTEVMAERFGAWRRIIRSLTVYLRDAASVQDDVYKQHTKLGHSINMPFFDNTDMWDAKDTTPIESTAPVASGLLSSTDDKTLGHTMFMGPGSHSLSDLPGSLTAYHSAQAVNAQRASRELVQVIIPRLEDLRRDLSIKIKEIRGLASDFKNSVAKEQNNTARELEAYVSAVELVTGGHDTEVGSIRGSVSGSVDVTPRTGPTTISPKQDPYLLRPVLERQLQRQVQEENDLLEAYLNLQGSGRELETVVCQEIQQALSTYASLMDSRLLDVRLVSHGFCSKDPASEWDAFISRDTNFIDPSLQPRQFDSLEFPHQHSLASESVREGYLERRSKYLKSYSRAWYVLTPSFLHEFKSADRRHEHLPVMSLALDECKLSQDKKVHHHHHSSSHKFILSAKGHNWVFRAPDEESLTTWYNDLSKLTSLNSISQRLELIAVSSPGIGTKGQVQGQGPGPASAKHLSNPSGPDPDREATPAAPALGVLGPSLISTNPPIAANSSSIQPPPISHQGSYQIPAPIAINSNSHLNSPIPSRLQTNSHNNNIVTDVPRSPVLSEISAVTSNGEPFDVSEYDHHPPQMNFTSDNADTSRKDRGRFPSQVNLQSGSHEPQAQHFVTAAELDQQNSNKNDDDDTSSVFSYDLNHTANTLSEDKDFQPVAADTPIEVERKLSTTHHKAERSDSYGIGAARNQDEVSMPRDEILTKRRSSSVASVNQRQNSLPVRRPTGSYGVEDLKPLSTAEKNKEPPLFFAKGLPQTTSGADKH